MLNGVQLSTDQMVGGPRSLAFIMSNSWRVNTGGQGFGVVDAEYPLLIR